MYSVSESYKKALLQKHITDTVEGTAVLKDGTVIELDDSTIVNGSLKITHELCNDYKVGTFNLGCMRIGFFDNNALGRDFSGAKITLTYKIKTEAGWEIVPLGIFIADGQTVIRRRNTVTLTAYDYGILFDCNLGVTLSNKTGTAVQIISDACERCGVEFGGIADGLPNTDVYVNCGSQRIQSCRDLVGWCAAMIGGYAVIDRSGALKIIPARYDVETDDPSVIIIDKYVTAAERNSIYSTDTRAWIAQMSAYSGDKTKIYKSNITRDDPHAARAIYYLEKNPLMESLDESQCDAINCAWLSFMDGFMQRGITAELYGDPALDVGDVLRCSEGDVDQRSSVVGLVTKQEWRYRNYHTVICASAQLSDGFPDDEDGESSDEAETVGTTDRVYPVKVVPQSEKKQGGGGGGDYTAGQGLSLVGNAFVLNAAGTANLGGVRLNVSPDVPSDDTSNNRTLGIYRGPDVFPTLRTATKNQKGGFFLGDGFVPVLEEGLNDSGDTVYTKTGAVQLRLGDGLEFVDDNEAATDLREIRENYNGGRKVAVKVDGQTVKLNDNGQLSAEGYAEGAAVAFRTVNQQKSINVKYDDVTIKLNGGDLAVNIDNDTIQVNDDGKLASIGVTVENGIVISEADASYLLHEYEEVKYVKGNKIGYSGPTSKIVCQGYVFDSLTPDKHTIGSDILYGTELDIRLSANVSTPPQTADVHIDAEYDANDRSKANCYLVCSAVNYRSAVGYYYDSVFGIYFKWDSIHAPNNNFPYGYVKGKVMMPGKAAKNATNFYNAAQLAFTAYFPFATEAEYNAAVGLTYEPLTLTEVQETTTEV